MNIGSVVDFPGQKPYCVLPIDVICRSLASINRELYIWMSIIINSLLLF